MYQLRQAAERGVAEHGWLSSRHTFSFAEYHDPLFMGFGPLRVINDDRVAQGAGFGRHPHRDMEIISYVIQGALEHKDSLGNGSIIVPGEVQLMRAGTGITHSEFNHSKTDEVHFLQIWVIPEQRGLQPGYDQRMFGENRRDKLTLVASRGGRDGSLDLAQDLDLYSSILHPGIVLHHKLDSARQAWIQLAEGELIVNDQHLAEGDGLAIVDEAELTLKTTSYANFLLFNMKKT